MKCLAVIACLFAGTLQAQSCYVGSDVGAAFRIMVSGVMGEHLSDELGYGVYSKRQVVAGGVVAVPRIFM